PAGIGRGSGPELGPNHGAGSDVGRKKYAGAGNQRILLVGELDQPLRRPESWYVAWRIGVDLVEVVTICVADPELRSSTTCKAALCNKYAVRVGHRVEDVTALWVDPGRWGIADSGRGV